MNHDAQLARVRALCEAAELPISDTELEALTPLYVLFSGGIEKLTALAEDTDGPRVRITPEP